MAYAIKTLPILLILVFVAGVRPLKKGFFNDDYLSQKTCNVIRGFFAIMVLFHHLCDYSNLGGLFITKYKEYGILSNAVFFFLSGYALLKRHKKDANYSKGFIKKRIAKLVVPYTIVNIMFLVFYAVFHNRHFTVGEYAQRCIEGDPLVSYSWFINEILLLYLFFYFMMRIFKKNNKRIVLCTCVFCLIIARIFDVVGYKSSWYWSTHMFAFGMIWCEYEKEILSFLKKKYLLSLSVVFLLFVPQFCCVKTGLNLIDKYSLEIIQILFVTLLMLIGLKVEYKNPLLSFMGSISMEFYMVQGLSIKLIRTFFDTSNELKEFALIIAFHICFSYVMKLFFDRITRTILKS